MTLPVPANDANVRNRLIFHIAIESHSSCISKLYLDCFCLPCENRAFFSIYECCLAKSSQKLEGFLWRLPKFKLTEILYFLYGFTSVIIIMYAWGKILQSVVLNLCCENFVVSSAGLRQYFHYVDVELMFPWSTIS